MSFTEGSIVAYTCTVEPLNANRHPLNQDGFVGPNGVHSKGVPLYMYYMCTHTSLSHMMSSSHLLYTRSGLSMGNMEEVGPTLEGVAVEEGTMCLRGRSTVVQKPPVDTI